MIFEKDGKMKKIMIVDDDPYIVLSIKEGLKEFDKSFEFVDAENGLECLKKLKNGEKPDLILLDIMMPNMDGWEVINKIHANYDWNKIPIIFLTAKVDDFTKTFASSIAMDFIEKPFEIADLRNRIYSVLKKAYTKSTLEH